jgi:hypothetical protein
MADYSPSKVGGRIAVFRFRGRPGPDSAAKLSHAEALRRGKHIEPPAFGVLLEQLPLTEREVRYSRQCQRAVLAEPYIAESENRRHSVKFGIERWSRHRSILWRWPVAWMRRTQQLPPG